MTTITYYSVITGEGYYVTQGVDLRTARRVAQEYADERGESVEIAEGPSEIAVETIEPTRSEEVV